MNWLNHLENLRSKPEEHRRRVAFWASTGITALVALIWVASLSFTLSSPVAKTAQVAAVGVSEEAASSTDTESSDSNFINDQKEKVIEGWRVITNQAKN